MADLAGGIHHVNISVSDLDRSAEWYTRLFGLKELRRLTDDVYRLRKILLVHPTGLLIGLTQHYENSGIPFEESLCGIDHVALAVDGLDALHHWEAQLDELGVTRSEIKTTPLGSLITIRDPDNVQIELYAAG
ncbi:MAG TPA: VOC family protein [Acidimicrobiales bacterium]|nr:VOC family protein [Acidimicrobiales bacterium]